MIQATVKQTVNWKLALLGTQVLTKEMQVIILSCGERYKDTKT